MATKFYVYHVATGRVLAAVDYDETTDGGPAGPRAAALGVVNPVTQYILAGVITARPVNTAGIDKAIVIADDTDLVILTGVPNPSKVRITAVSENQAPLVIDVTDGTANITFNRAGAYEILVQSFPAQDAQFFIQAVAP
jgi:hypothetical protein